MPETTEAALHPTRSRDGKLRLAPLAAGVLVVLLLGAVAFAVRSASGPGAATKPGLPVLRLESMSGALLEDAPASEPGRNHYLLAGALPSARPDPAPVYRTGAGDVPEALVRRLAGALGLPGNPKRVPGGWQLATKDRALTVLSGSWMWQLNHGGVTADSPVQCFRAPCPNETTHPHDLSDQPALSPAVAQQIASDTLRKLGLQAGDLTTNTNGQQTEVRAPRSVGQVDAFGFETGFTIDSNRTITGGFGWLGAPRRGPAYPLVTAAEAFRRLQAMPYAEIALCRPQRGGGCAPAAQLKVTGARLGLMTARAADGTMLVPGWLFTVEGQVNPSAVVAVESRYIQPHTEAKPTSGTSGPITGGGPPPKSSSPSAPDSVPPAGPSALHNPGTPPPG